MKKLTLNDDYKFIVDNFDDMTKESFCDLSIEFITRMKKEEISFEEAKSIIGTMTMEILMNEQRKKAGF